MIEKSQKYCSRCQLTLPIDNFGKNKGRYDELTVYCRLCTYQYSKAQALERVRTQNFKKAEFRHCGLCNEDKDCSEFHYNSQSYYGLSAYCKECVNLKTRADYSRTEESRRAKLNKNREWQSNNKVRVNELGRKSYYKDVEKSRKKALKYQKENPEQNRQNASRYRARMKENGVSKVSYKHIIETNGMVCHICGLSIHSMSELHFDHVIPISKGGPHEEQNIKPSHAICNMKKGSKLLS